MLSSASVRAMLPAGDIDRAKKFYGEVLGLTMLEENESTVTYECGGGTTLSVYPSAHAGTNEATAAEFRVTDLDAAKIGLEARGVVFEDYDLPGFTTVEGVLTLSSGGRGAWFRDSESNIISLTQRVP